VGSIGKGRMLIKLVLFREASLRRALTEYIHYFHDERNHQGKATPFYPSQKVGQRMPRSRVRCRQRLGGLLKYYSYAT
jgi:hypothetical protein